MRERRQAGRGGEEGVEVCCSSSSLCFKALQNEHRYCSHVVVIIICQHRL